ncbi:putative transcription factor/ chromatin remodeling BED-type(Zn) family protein [Tanacetum coccineum]
MASGSASIPSVEPNVYRTVKKIEDVVGSMVIYAVHRASRIESNVNLCEKLVSGFFTRLKQHIAQITGQTTSCPKATKEDQLKCRNAINEGKLKKQGKRQHDEAIRSEVRLDSNESLEDDEVHDDSMKEPNAILFGKKDWDLQRKYVARWADEVAIPFHAFEKDSFKMLLEVVGQFGPGNPTPNYIFSLSTPLLKEEVERTKNLVKRNEKEWKDEGCSIMTDAWSDRKRRSIMNLFGKLNGWPKQRSDQES